MTRLAGTIKYIPGAYDLPFYLSGIVG